MVEANKLSKNMKRQRLFGRVNSIIDNNSNNQEIMMRSTQITSAAAAQQIDFQQPEEVKSGRRT